MIIRFAFALGLLLATPVAAQTTSAAPIPAENIVKVALDQGKAPVTTGNFLKYVDGGRFNGESFYRAMKFAGAAGSSRVESPATPGSSILRSNMSP